MSRQPEPWRSLRGEIQKIWEQLRRMQSASPFFGTGMHPVGDDTMEVDVNLNIADTGRLTFPVGGSLLANDTSGREYAYLGGFTTNGFGMTLTRINGSPALVFADDDALEEAVQRLRLYDSDARPLLTEDDSGSGAGWPLAPVPFAGVSWPTWDSNNTGSFVTVATALTYKSSPRLYVTCNHIADGTAAGQVRLLANGAQLGATATVANLAMGQTAFGTPLDLPDHVGDPVTLEVQTRVTSGTGKAYARVTAAMQWPS